MSPQLCRARGTHEMLLGNDRPRMDGPVLTLVQVLLLFPFKLREGKKKSLRKIIQKKKTKNTTKEIDFPKIALS